jgi:RNA polymerase sigma-70 factor (ECF subfamily)
VDELDALAARFEASRERLTSVAYRMLGSRAEAEDAVQEAWLRLHRAHARSADGATGSGADAIDNLTGWLTTVVARVSLDMLRSRTTRREDPLAPEGTAARPAAGAAPADPAEEAATADAVGLALLVVLDSLEPAERLAFVLHDMFAVPFDEIAPVVGRTPDAARQLASRARRRVRGASTPEADLVRQREVVRAFLAASREGDFDALLAVLDPDATVRSDPAAVAAGSDPERHGARAVAAMFAGRAHEARLALLGAAVGAVWAPGGTARVAFAFAVAEGRITGIEVIADRERLSVLDPVILPDP